MKLRILFFLGLAVSIASCKKDEENFIKLDTIKGINLGGWDGRYGSGLDADNGVVYGYGSLSGATRYVDIFFDRSAFFSYDADGTQMPDVGTRFAATEFTTVEFDSMEDDRSFVGITPSATTDSVQFVINDVVFFQTRWGKKGLVKIISMTSPTGDLVCDLKVQER